MSEFTSVSNMTQILSILTIIAQAVVVFLLVVLLLGRKKSNPILQFFGKRALWLSFIVSLIATLGSLYFSEVAGFSPCKLCWYQRILMYPQVLLLAIAWKKQDFRIKDYLIPLSAIGAVVAAFHYYLQVSATKLTSCSTVGYSASCSEQFVTNFGYITIPMMALTGFVLITLLLSCRDKSIKSPV